MIESRIDALLAAMTLEEKVALCHGDTMFTIPGVPRLGVPGLTMSDGPCGVREEQTADSSGSARRTDDAATALPPGICLAATWNPDLARRYGATLGAEARARGKDVILGPSINIHRTPLCGRNFEYMGEDPHLVARLVAPLVRGIQEQGVAASVKHFALNNQELARREVNVEVDERALREIYLAGFEAAVKEGGALTVMGAYNRFRGRFCCHNPYLLDTILKQEWGFQGLVVSDWGGVRSTEEAATAGLDVEMGTSRDCDAFYLARAYLEGLREGRYPVDRLDDKVRRILRVIAGIGKWGDVRRPSGALNTACHQATARDVAAEGIVLLKNQRGLLPLDRTAIRTILVVGENATARHCRGGGSAEVKPLYEITPVDGLRAKLGDAVTILHAAGYPDIAATAPPLPVDCLGSWGILGGIRGWQQSRFANARFEGEPLERTVVPSVEFQMPCRDMTPGESSVEWKGVFTVPVTGIYEFTLCATEWTGVKLDGTWICMTKWQVDTPAVFKAQVPLEAGQVCSLLVHSFIRSATSSVRFGCRLPDAARASRPEGQTLLAEAVALARKVDAVIFVGGLSHADDTEGFDRKALRLPHEQDALIAALAAANRRTIVVLNGSGPVEMPWLDRVKAVLMAWYPGMEGGNALADVLFGDVNPSGKLPISLPAKLDDCPAHSVGEYRDDVEHYSEGILVGYRHYDTRGIAPLFPFGHGLSYTRFAYRGLKVVHAGSDLLLTVFCTVRNAGPVAGAEVVQCYIAAEGGRLPRPAQELKAFRKIRLQPGESTTLRMDIDRRTLSVYDPDLRDWVLDATAIRVRVGSSSRDIRLETRIENRLP